MQKRIIITGTGAVAGAIARALIPAGYEVSTISRGPTGITVYKNLAKDWIATPENVISILNGSKAVEPLDVLETCSIPNKQLDLSKKSDILQNHLEGADVLIMTAANPNSDQSKESAENNYQIDVNTLNAAIKAKVKTIIYTSSVWRTVKSSYSGSRKIPITPDSEAPDRSVPYALAKVESVKYLKKLASENKNIIFTHIDLGWYPRETMGAPISNVSDLYLQWWIAECELQQHYLQLVSLENNPSFKGLIANGENYFSFNGFSNNEPPNGLAHIPFSYDLTTSGALLVKHQFNVYYFLKNKTSGWRRIPIPSK